MPAAVAPDAEPGAAPDPTPDPTTDAVIARPVAVRELCAFAARRGDLDRRFTPAPSAREGIAGHGRVTGRRGPDYRRELALAGTIAGVALRGRADGFDPAGPRLEEIKTHRGDVARVPDNHRALHWAQLKVYGALYCLAQGCAELPLALVYLDIDDDVETVFEETASAEALLAFATGLVTAFRDWQRQEAAHRQARDAALRTLRFPHAGFHAGQYRLAKAVYRCARDGGALLAQAPTGTGKTLGTLFPALHALAEAGLDKLLYLTAKTPLRQLALDALASLDGALAAAAGDGLGNAEGNADDAPPSRPASRSPPPPLPLRVLELSAREQACLHPDRACHGDACPLARGFYDRLPAARAAALAAGAVMLDTGRLRTLAQTHAVCPYYLAQELVRWADVIVGDVHYQYDGGAMLPALAALNDWRVVVLVDEAHNLIDRAREMYSATLSQAVLRAAQPVATPPLRQALRRIDAALAACDAPGATPAPARAAIDRVRDGDHDDAANRQFGPDDRRVLDADADPPPLAAVPDALAPALAGFLAEAARAQAADPQPFPPALQAAHFAALGFARLIDSFDRHSLLLREARPDGLSLHLRNLVPAPFLAPRHAAAQASILFSATLAPADYYRDLLGLPAGTPWLDVESPFAATQLEVRIADRVPTRFERRPASALPIARLIVAQHQRAPGHYLVFLPSFDYLALIEAALRQLAPALPLRVQPRTAQAEVRRAFVDGFDAEGHGIALAVLGGAFAEGIDLPGRRLIGAFVVSLGLPQFNARNEWTRLRLAESFGEARGRDYTYLYPGLRKVVQAAGRIIRSPADRGTLWLIDPRYRDPAVQALLPRWWALP